MEMIPNEGFPRIAKCEPFRVIVKPGIRYKWCTCGLSATQPFCDHSHRDIEGAPYKSLKIEFDKEQEVLFCQCKQTSTPPFCDDTHLKLNNPG